MKKHEFKKLRVGDRVFSHFGNSYRRCEITNIDNNHATLYAGIGLDGFRIERRAAYKSIDRTPTKQWVGWIDAPSVADDPLNSGRQYSVAAFDRLDSMVESTGFVGNLSWAYHQIRKMKSKNSDIHCFIITQHATAGSFRVV